MPKELRRLLMKETINYNKDGIRSVTFHYNGTQKDLDMFMKMIISDCVKAELESLSRKSQD